jgi:hypothetical protein
MQTSDKKDCDSTAGHYSLADSIKERIIEETINDA